MTTKVENYLMLANTYMSSGETDKAINYCDKALEIDPENYLAWITKYHVELYVWKDICEKSNRLSDYEITVNFSEIIDVLDSWAERIINDIQNAFTYANEHQTEYIGNDILNYFAWLYFDGIEKMSIKYMSQNDYSNAFDVQRWILFEIECHCDEVYQGKFMESYIEKVIYFTERFSNRRDSANSEDKTESYYICESVLDGILKEINDRNFSLTDNEIVQKCKNKHTYYELLFYVQLAKGCTGYSQQDAHTVSLFDNAKTKIKELYTPDMDIPDSVRNDIEYITNLDLSNRIHTQNAGCYIATCVYGSYDCPEVWSLRRYRDFRMKETLLGRAFISAYYCTSPIIVRVCGNNKVFKTVCKHFLDKIVKRLKSKGYGDTRYTDI